MDATQQIEDPFTEEDDDDEKEENKEGSKREQVATLKVFKNDHVPETEFPLYVGENVLGRDPVACSVLLPARSVSGRHAVISISVFRSSNNRPSDIEAVEALLWDTGSLNGTRKGRLKLTPQVRYALAEGDSVVVADIPCQYIRLHVSKRDTQSVPKEKGALKHEKKESPSVPSSHSEPKIRKGVLNENVRGALPPVPLWSPEEEEPKSAVSLCSPQPAYKQPEITLVPDSDSGSDGESATDEKRDVVSDSASSSHLVSPSDSTFLTPAKKVIPESEDESSITPSSATMDQFKVKDSFSEVCSDSSKTGPLALNLDSDTDIEEEETDRDRNGADAQTKVASKVEPVYLGDLHMDSDTDVEEEETDNSKAEPEAQKVHLKETVSSTGLHLDSDTDVEEEETEKSKTEQQALNKEASRVESVTSADLHMDSDTDVEEEETEKSKSEQQALNKEASRVESVTSADLHMDSDTDVEEEETEKSKSETETQIKQAPEVEPLTSSDLHMDSDTDVEENDATHNAEPPKVVAVSESPLSAHAEIHLDSDTDVEDDNPMDVPTATEVSHPAVKDSDIRLASNPGAKCCMDSDTDVDEEENEDPFKSLPGKVAENQKVSTGSKVEQPEKSTHKQTHPFQAHTHHEEPTLAFDNLDDWDLQPTQAYGGTGANAGIMPKEVDLEATQAYGADTGREDEEEPLSRSEVHSNLSTAETQLIPTAKSNDEDYDEEMPDDFNLSTADTLILASTPRRDEQTQHFALFTAPTQLIWEGEEKEVDQSEPVQLVEADTIDETQDCEKENINWGRKRSHVGGRMQKYKTYSTSQLIIAETQPMCEDEYASNEGQNSATTSKHTGEDEHKHLREEPSSSHVTIAETQPMFEEDETLNTDLKDRVNSRRPQGEEHESTQVNKSSASHLVIAETQPMCEGEGTSDEGLNSAVSSRNTHDEPKNIREEPSSSHVTIAETQPVFEEELKIEVNSGKLDTRQAKEHESTQLTDKISSSTNLDENKPVEHPETPSPPAITVTETQPMCEEQETPQEDQNNAGPDRSNQLQKTQPVHEEDEGQDKELSSKISSRRSRRGRPKKQEEVSQPAEGVVHHTIAETQPICEEENKNDEDLNVGMKSRRNRRGRPSKKDDVPQPAESEEKTEEEDVNSGIRSKRSRRGRQTDEAEPAESHEPNSDLNVVEEDPANAGSSCQTRKTGGRKQRKEKTDQENESGTSSKGPGRARKGQEGKRNRRRALSEEEEESEEEKTRRWGTRRTGMKQKCTEKVGEEELVENIENNVQEEKEKLEKELQEQEARARLEREEQERLECERRENEEREERERQKLEREQKELEEKERLKREEEEKQKEENERMDQLKREKDRLEKELKEKLERQRLEKEEEERIQREKMKKELKEKEHLQRLEVEREQLEKERQENEMLEMAAQAQLKSEQKDTNQQEEQKNETLEEKNTELNAFVVSPNDDVPVRRSRRHSNSSVNSEQSVSSQQEQSSQRGRGRGRGRGQGRPTTTEQPVGGRQSGRRKTIPGPADDVEKTEQGSITPSRSRSSSRSADRSSNSIGTQNQVTRGRGRGRKSVKLPEPEEEVFQPKTPGRGRGRPTTTEQPVGGRQSGRRKTIPGPADDVEETEQGSITPSRSRSSSRSSDRSSNSIGTQNQVTRGRGRGRKSVKLPEPEEEVFQPKTPGRGRGRPTTTKQPVGGRQSGRRKTIPGPADDVEETEQGSITPSRSRSSSRSSDRSSNSIGTQNQVTRGRGRGGKSVKLPEPEEEVFQPKTPGRGRGKGSRKGTNVEINTKQDEEVVEEAVVPQTNSRGRKRTATASTSSVETPPPAPKTPRRSTASQMQKVLFTGLTDEDGERVVAQLGGSLAKGVNDMTHLVTDKARRTVKFLCAIARGVPIVTPDWLKKCGKAGHFLSADEYLLKDVEQEKKFSFSLQAALQAALRQPLLKGYEIHVTPSVMPEPSQMKEIITCCGARFLPKMPSAHKDQTVVVSCEQDRALCEKASRMSLPVVSTEFLLTGILQQKVDWQAYSLTSSLNAANQTAAPKAPARGRRK